MRRTYSLIVFLILLCLKAVGQNLQYSWHNIYDGSGTQVYDVTSDYQGNIIAVGKFAGTVDFDPGTNVLELYSNGSSDAFVTKIDSDGNLLWAISFGSSGTEDVEAVEVDNEGNIYIAGEVRDDTVFLDGIGLPDEYIVGSNEDVYLMKLNSEGNAIWAKTFGGEVGDKSYDIELDIDGNLYVGGYCYGGPNYEINFDTDSQDSIRTSVVDRAGFVAKYSNEGSLIWSRLLQANISSGYCQVQDLAAGAGKIVAVGHFTENIASLGSSIIAQNDLDGFLIEFDVDGNYTSNTVISSPGFTGIYAADYNDQGELLCSSSWGGNSGSVLVDGVNILNLSSNTTCCQNDNGLILKFDTQGSLDWTVTLEPEMSSLGGEFFGTSPYSVASAELRNYAYGYYRGVLTISDGTNTYQIESVNAQNNDHDIFLVEITDQGQIELVSTVNGLEGQITNVNNCIHADDGNLYVNGWLYDDCNLFPELGGPSVPVQGTPSSFVAKLTNDNLVSVSESGNPFGQVNVYPNPSNGKYYINAKGNVRVFDAMGKEVYRTSSFNAPTEVDLSTFPSGIYTIQLTNKGGVFTGKVVRE